MMKLKGTLDRIITYAVSVTEPEEIILFGSHAEGRADVHSDIDLLIITETPAGRKEMIEMIRNYAYRFSLKADVLICRRSRLEEEMASPNSFIKAVYKAGKRVYKK